MREIYCAHFSWKLKDENLKSAKSSVTKNFTSATWGCTAAKQVFGRCRVFWGDLGSLDSMSSSPPNVREFRIVGPPLPGTLVCNARPPNEGKKPCENLSGKSHLPRRSNKQDVLDAKLSLVKGFQITQNLRILTATTHPKKPLTRVSKPAPEVHGKRGWRGLAKGWHRVAEGLAGSLAPSNFGHL